MTLKSVVWVGILKALVIAGEVRGADLRQLRVVDLEERVDLESMPEPPEAVIRENREREMMRKQYEQQIADTRPRMEAYTKARDNAQLPANVRSAAKGFAIVAAREIAASQQSIGRFQPFERRARRGQAEFCYFPGAGAPA